MKQDGTDDKIWTGLPLRAHRRCNNPMFAIANEIAHSNQMVKAMDDIPFDCALGNSTWFDIDGSTIQDKQVVEEEIYLLKEKILLLEKISREVFVISPFKAVADRCKKSSNLFILILYVERSIHFKVRKQILFFWYLAAIQPCRNQGNGPLKSRIC